MKNNSNKMNTFLNNYGYCDSNSYLEGKLKEYIDTVTSIELDKLESYLRNLRGKDGINISLIPGQDKYNFHNYMYILESAFNYILTLRNLVYKDYVENDKDKKYIYLIKGLNDRCSIILNIYEKEEEIHNKKYKVSEVKIFKVDGNKKHKKINAIPYDNLDGNGENKVKTYGGEIRTYRFG